MTVVVVLPVLLVVLGSGVAELAVAVLVSLPAVAVTLTTIVILANEGDRRLPSDTVTVPLVPTGGTDEQNPWVVVQETNVVPGGNGSVTVVEPVASGPSLLTVIV